MNRSSFEIRKRNKILNKEFPLSNFYENNCPYCGTEKVTLKEVRYRKIKGEVSVFRCNICGKHFTADIMSLSNNPIWVVCNVIDSFVSGINSQKICRMIKRIGVERGSNISISKQTIFNIVLKVSNILTEYELLLPVLLKSKVWEFDEAFVWMDNNDDHFVEIIYDVDSKYVLAANVVKLNNEDASFETVEIARIRAKCLPKLIRTDANPAHISNIKKNYRRVKHDYKPKGEKIDQINFSESFNSKMRAESSLKRKKRFKSKLNAQISADLYRFEWNFS